MSPASRPTSQKLSRVFSPSRRVPPGGKAGSAAELMRKASAPEPNSKSLTSPLAEIPHWRHGSPGASTPGRVSTPLRCSFSNSDPKVKADLKPDVRALSFAVELPPGAAADAGSSSTRGRTSRCKARPRSRSMTSTPLRCWRRCSRHRARPEACGHRHSATNWYSPAASSKRCCRHVSRFGPISYCATGATCRSVMDRTMS